VLLPLKIVDLQDAPQPAAEICTANAVLCGSTAKSTMFMPPTVQNPQDSVVPTRCDTVLAMQSTILPTHSVRKGYNF